MNDLDIFSAALELSTTDEREKYVIETCGNNAALRERVEALLQSSDKVSRFMESPALGIAASPTIDPPITEKPGTQIGPYKLLQQIGDGGMGVVYMAEPGEQAEPGERHVALKIVKPGMDSKQVIARFEAERQALALMDHTNIAEVLDAGTTDSGRPYFVMELVKGLPITKYSDTQQLTPKERLELFLPVCQAVQHAHQKGVIHRDLKPSNILVARYDEKAVPKVIDFGIAKAISQRLTEKTMFTQYGQIVGTIEYMSPEQAQFNQLDVDTRSDIYSLGVLLYELLTGETPLDKDRLRDAAFEDVLRTIRQGDPPTPSTRLSDSQTLPAIAEARRTEPDKLCTLVHGELDWIVMKAMEKDRSRRYETAAALADDIERFLHDEPVEACAISTAYRLRKFARRNKLAVATTALVMGFLLVSFIGASAAAFIYQNLADENATLALERGQLATRLASEIQTAENNLDLATAEQQRAESNLDLALDALDSVYVQAIGRDRLLAADNTPGVGLTPSEERLLRIGLGLYEQIASQNPDDESARNRIATARFRVGQLKRNLSDPQGARDAFDQALAQFQQLTRHVPRNVGHSKILGDVLAARARLDSSWNPDARTDFKDAIASYTSAIEIDPDDANLYAARAATLAAAGRSRAAEQDYLRAIELDPDSAQLHETLGWMYAFPPHQNKTKAVVHLERAVELEPTARSLGMLARVRFMIQDDYEGAWELLEQAVQDDPLELEPRVQRAVWCFNQERYEDALGEIDQVLDIAPRYSYALRWRGKIHGQLERYDEALADFAAAQPMERSHPFWWLVQRSDVYTAMGRHEDAFADLVRAVQVRPEGGFSWHKLDQASRQVSDTDAAVETLQPLCESSDPSITARAHALLASIFLRLEQFDDAETSLARAAESRQQHLDAGPNKTHTLPTANDPFRVVLPWITSCPDAQLRSRLRALVGEFAETNSRTEKETQPDR